VSSVASRSLPLSVSCAAYANRPDQCSQYPYSAVLTCSELRGVPEQTLFECPLTSVGSARYVAHTDGIEPPHCFTVRRKRCGPMLSLHEYCGTQLVMDGSFGQTNEIDPSGRHAQHTSQRMLGMGTADSARLQHSGL
jgi:hypothetical protein